MQHCSRPRKSSINLVANGAAESVYGFGAPIEDTRANWPIFFGPFSVTKARRLLECDGEPVPIGSRAFDILTHLLEHHGKVVSHGALLAAAWPDTNVVQGCLRFQMAALREALGNGQGSYNYIINVPGRGYCFTAPISRRNELEEASPLLAEIPIRRQARKSDMDQAIDYDALMQTNLKKVFCEPDSKKRMQAISELYATDAILNEPEGSFQGRVAICDAVSAVLAGLPPNFEFTALGPAIGHHGVGRLRWSAGPPGGPVAVTGMDIAHFQEGRIHSLFVFIDPPVA